jgi:hypothetical protein
MDLLYAIEAMDLDDGSIRFMGIDIIKGGVPFWSDHMVPSGFMDCATAVKEFNLLTTTANLCNLPYVKDMCKQRLAGRKQVRLVEIDFSSLAGIHSKVIEEARVDLTGSYVTVDIRRDAPKA